MSIYYTYYVKWSKTGISYYGCSYRKGANPKQFWTSYFTSSDYVKLYIIEHGDPDIKKITKTFDSVEECRNHESRFLLKTKARKNNKLLNMSNPGSYGIKQYKSIFPPHNITSIGIVERLVTKTGNILGIKNNFGRNPSRTKIYATYKDILKIRFDTIEERSDFLSVNKHWDIFSYSTDVNTKKKLSEALLGKKKPKRTKEHRDNLRTSQIGKPKPSSGPKGKTFYTNGIIEILSDECPEGFYKGRMQRVKYNNGLIERMFLVGQIEPGFVPGRLKSSSTKGIKRCSYRTSS